MYTRIRTPYDRPSIGRIAGTLAVIVLLSASTANHAGIEHDLRDTGYETASGYSDDSGYGNPRVFPNIRNYLDLDDPSLALYREPLTREAVTDFFRDVTGSEKVAVAVLETADEFDMKPTKAFSIAFIESSYRTDAVNTNNNQSTDRGLFQLNDRTFPNLDNDDFFHPETSAWYGIRHLSFALNQADGDFLTAVAIYNAGPSRVFSDEIPDSTQAYMQRIDAYRDDLIRDFRDFIADRFPPERDRTADAR